MYNFFVPDEAELEQVIKNTLATKDAFISAKTIQTGWTNITMDVHGEAHNYIFRFPRNMFFAHMMIKDCTFCHFLKGKVSLPIPEMSLKMDKERPFSVHKKIKGNSLTSQIEKLSALEQAKIIDDLAQFLAELHALPTASMPKEIEETLGHFLAGLSSVHKGNYDLHRHDSLCVMEKGTDLSIVHGDFHPSNILIDEGKVSGIIDFSFASISDKCADLGRFWGRSNATLGQALVDSYQSKTKRICDLKKVHDIVDIFKYVEYKYVQYMQQNHPEIAIPESVLQASALEAARLHS